MRALGLCEFLVCVFSVLNRLPLQVQLPGEVEIVHFATWYLDRLQNNGSAVGIEFQNPATHLCYSLIRIKHGVSKDTDSICGAVGIELQNPAIHLFYRMSLLTLCLIRIRL